MTNNITFKNTDLPPESPYQYMEFILMPEIPNTATSCSQHGLDIILLTLEWPGRKIY
jgi:hypothetical protein